MSKFTKDMTVQNALAAHSKARDVFAGFNLGGCAFCAIGEFETVAQVCEGYNVPVDTLLETLNSLPTEQ